MTSGIITRHLTDVLISSYSTDVPLEFQKKRKEANGGGKILKNDTLHTELFLKWPPGLSES